MGKADRTNPFNQWRKSEAVTVHEAYDQFGRQIGVGDFVILEQHGGVIWRVTETKPIMRPDVPPGLIELTLAAITQFPLQGGAPIPGLIKVRDALEYMTAEQLERYKVEARIPGGGVGGAGTGEPIAPSSDEPPSAPPEPSRIVLP